MVVLLVPPDGLCGTLDPDGLGFDRPVLEEQFWWWFLSAAAGSRGGLQRVPDPNQH